MLAEIEALRRVAHARLIEDLEPESVIDRQQVATTVAEIAPLIDRSTLNSVIDAVLDDVHGLGALEQLMNDPDVSDVMIVGGRGVWIERNGQIEELNTTMTNSEIEHVIARIVGPLGLRVDRASPMVDARLTDGSRVNAVVPPLAVDGPCMTVRRFGAKPIELSQIAAGPVERLLRDAVRNRMNLVVSGGTGSGKTTLLNALCTSLEDSERVITIEDAAELRLPLKHVVRLESRAANTEGVGHVSLRELVRNALRMRPDRIIVGEVRGPEALVMLQAMNPGHEGSMSTCHANSCFDALRRIETMVLMGETALPIDAVRQQMVSSIDLIVQISRLANGARAVTTVCEVIDRHGVPDVRMLADQNKIVAMPQRSTRIAAS